MEKLKLYNITKNEHNKGNPYYELISCDEGNLAHKIKERLNHIRLNPPLNPKIHEEPYSFIINAYLNKETPEEFKQKCNNAVVTLLKEIIKEGNKYIKEEKDKFNKYIYGILFTCDRLNIIESNNLIIDLIQEDLFNQLSSDVKKECLRNLLRSHLISIEKLKEKFGQDEYCGLLFRYCYGINKQLSLQFLPDILEKMDALKLKYFLDDFLGDADIEEIEKDLDDVSNAYEKFLKGSLLDNLDDEDKKRRIRKIIKMIETKFIKGDGTIEPENKMNYPAASGRGNKFTKSISNAASRGEFDTKRLTLVNNNSDAPNNVFLLYYITSTQNIS